MGCDDDCEDVVNERWREFLHLLRRPLNPGSAQEHEKDRNQVYESLVNGLRGIKITS